MPEPTWEERFRAGDPEAVRSLYLEYGGAAYTIALRALGEPSLAAECVRRTFLQAWREAGRFDPDRAVGPWLHAIARRAAIDLHLDATASAQDSPGTEAGGSHLPLSFERTWEAWEVRMALDQLPRDEREIVRRIHLDGLTQGEVARETGVPIGAVKSRALRAHRRLAGLLSHLVEANA